MPGCRALLAFVALSLPSAFVPAAHAQDPVSTAPAARFPTVRAVHPFGARELSAGETIEAIHVRIGEPLPAPLDRLEKAVERRYSDEGYPFARVTAAFDADSGALTLSIDEGVIDAVEFQGVPETVQRSLAADFALRSGDVFNTRRAKQALDAALRPARGALEPGQVRESAIIGTADVDEPLGPFDLIDRNGRRVLVVGVRERSGRFRAVPNFGDREDWFTPVDGFVPSIGFGAAVFDQEDFNHRYVTGLVSFKTASRRVGYAIGGERPFFVLRKLYVGGEVHDLTVTDDTWQVSSLEASVAAIGARRSFRDYYRQQAVQANAAWRVHRQVELLAAWRIAQQDPLAVQTDFSFFNGDDAFRPNLTARGGRLRELLLGASVDGPGFDRESLEATYRRHQLDAPFGQRLNKNEDQGTAPVWRIDWTSELSPAGAFGSDFDFSRHIVSARLRKRLSPRQDVGVRAIGGWSGGVLPPQRLFAIGGIGSVHGYEFKESVGDALALLNVEYGIGWGNDLRFLGLFDAGRVTSRTAAGVEPGVGAPTLKGIGFGVAIGDAFRIDFGYKLGAVPGSPHVLMRFDRTF
jgi:hypothetical protein